MNKILFAAALLTLSTAATAQQELMFPTEPTVQGDNPRTRTSEGGSSYYAEIQVPPRVAQVVQPAPVYVAPAPTPAPVVAAAPPQTAPAPYVAPVTPEPVRTRKPDRN